MLDLIPSNNNHTKIWINDMYIICCYHVVLTFDESENIIYSFDMIIDNSFYKYRLVSLFTTKDPNL